MLPAKIYGFRYKVIILLYFVLFQFQSKWQLLCREHRSNNIRSRQHGMAHNCVWPQWYVHVQVSKAPFYTNAMPKALRMSTYLLTVNQSLYYMSVHLHYMQVQLCPSVCPMQKMRTNRGYIPVALPKIESAFRSSQWSPAQTFLKYWGHRVLTIWTKDCCDDIIDIYSVT